MKQWQRSFAYGRKAVCRASRIARDQKALAFLNNAQLATEEDWATEF